MNPPKRLRRYAKAYDGSVRRAADKLGLSVRQSLKLRKECVAVGLIEEILRGQGNRPRHGGKPAAPVVEGQVHAKRARQFAQPAVGQPPARYLFTCAQNDTKLHAGFWRNLLAFAEHVSAEIHVARFTYVKRGLGASGDKAVITKKAPGEGGFGWAPELVPYFSDERAEVAPGLVWCGEMNILPTASRPISGLESYTGRSSTILPHVKIAMESVPTTRDAATKFVYTTGAVTQRNYIQRKAGLKAEFHHCYAALLVEVDEFGSWWCRQINADSDGDFQDLTSKVIEGEVIEGCPVEAITWGDIHVAEADASVHDLAFRPGGMLDELMPRHQFVHDVLHFRGRSHHEIKNPHKMFLRHIQGHDNVRKEIEQVGTWLIQVSRSWCDTHVVPSNHHDHLDRWLMEQDGRRDPINAEFWLMMSAAIYDQIRDRGDTPTLQLALEQLGYHDLTGGFDINFIRRDDSFVVCEDMHGGIECALHGDVGPNGARGSAQNLAKMGRRANIGHSHSARIVDGVYQSGTCGELSPDWTSGPSSWSHSHTVTYPNGKRAIVTMWKNKWRA